MDFERMSSQESEMFSDENVSKSCITDISEFQEDLMELKTNSKSRIDRMTTLAQDNIEYAFQIVEILEIHIMEAPRNYKLPALYLIDSILKNIRLKYVMLFNTKIISIFTTMFRKADKHVRKEMFRMRGTWILIFPIHTLHDLDLNINLNDPNWPVMSKEKMNILKIKEINIKYQRENYNNGRNFSRTRKRSLRNRLLVKQSRMT